MLHSHTVSRETQVHFSPAPRRRSRRIPRPWLAAALIAALAPPAVPADDAEATSLLGRTVADFTLKDSRGSEHTLSKLDAKFVVVVFVGAECPLAKMYGPRLDELHAAYKDRGVAVLGVNSNRQDSLAEIAAHVRAHGIAFPLITDPGNRVADDFKAERTPEAFVLDANRVVKYHGRIDDQYGVGYARDKPNRRDLETALDQLLAGKPVDVAETKPVGCFIGRVRTKPAKDDAPVTWSKDIAPLFERRCVECHRDGEIAPFSLVDPAEVVGWADTIREVVQERRMPPWHASPEHGRFANARRLSDAEVRLVEDWVEAGAPLGDARTIDVPAKADGAWQAGREPDLVVAMRDAPFDVPAQGTVDYKYFTVDPKLTEDRWISMAEVQPGDRAVVHHVLVLVRPPEGSPAGAGGGEFLAGYVPGMRATPYPEGMAKLIPKGSKLVFQLHYTPNGTPRRDLSRIGLYFADPDEITHVVVTSRAAENRFSIPPNEGDHKVEASSPSSPADLLLLSMMPHMHLRGKSFTYEAVMPGGRRTTLLDVPRYDFNWQTSYRLAEPLAMPAGSRMHCVARFDNSTDNPANPDPGATVRWGDQTWNEMMIGYFDVAVPIGQAAPARARRPVAANPEARRREAEQLVKRFDADGDGKVARKEVPERILPIFTALDKDEDGFVTVEEVIQGGALRR